MNDFDRFVVEASIRSRVGEPDAIDVVGRRIRTPMTAFLEVAERAAGTPIDMLWVDGGIPGHFALRADDAISVVFHSRQVELCAHLRSLLLDGVMESTLRCDVFESAALRMIAEFLLQRGRVDQALQTLAQSRRARGVFLVEPHIAQLEHLPLDERYLVEWFFALGHEIGHAAGQDVRTRLGSITALSSAWIAHIVDAIVTARFESEGARATLRRIIRGESDPGITSHASPSVVLEEAIADLFSVVCMNEAWAVICASATERDLRLDVLMTEVLVSMSSVMVIEQCRILAGWFSSMQDEIERQPLMLAGVALQARMNLVIQALGEDVWGVLGELLPGARSLGSFRHDDVSAVREALQARSLELGPGLARAREFLSSREMRDPELFYGYVETVAGDGVIAADARRFLAVARSQKVTSPELDLLRKAAGG